MDNVVHPFPGSDPPPATPRQHVTQMVRDDPAVAAAWQHVQDAFSAYEIAVREASDRAEQRGGSRCPTCGRCEP